MPPLYLPRGSALWIEGTDLVINGGDGTKKWNKVSEHSRSPIELNVQRIEKIVRTSNGTLRKNYTADKRSFSMSWDLLPSYRTLTVDGGWGAEDLRQFYLGDDGKKTFNIRINLAKAGSDQSSSGFEAYTVSFTSCNFTVVKRGVQPHWNVSISMEEV